MSLKPPFHPAPASTPACANADREAVLMRLGHAHSWLCSLQDAVVKSKTADLVYAAKRVTQEKDRTVELLAEYTGTDLGDPVAGALLGMAVDEALDRVQNGSGTRPAQEYLFGA